MSKHVLTEHQNFESRKRTSDFNRVSTEHHEHGSRQVTGNIPPGTMDEAYQQRGDPAAEPEIAVTESLDETMYCDLVAPIVSTPTPVNWDQVNRGQRKQLASPQQPHEIELVSSGRWTPMTQSNRAWSEYWIVA